MQPLLPGNTAIYILTLQGLSVGERIVSSLAGDFRLFVAASLHTEKIERRIAEHVPCPFTFFTNLPQLVQSSFTRYSCHIFIAATGIVVRSIAPMLDSKLTDPAVLVVDQQPRFVISLLSGHIGGANIATETVAKVLEATPVITTATDVAKLPAIDLIAHLKGLALGNASGIKHVSAALLADKQPILYDPENWLDIVDSPWESLFIQTHTKPTFTESDDQSYIIVTEEMPSLEAPPSALFLHPPVLFAGIGCQRGITSHAILSLLQKVLSDVGLSWRSLAGIATVDIKQHELGLLEAVKQLTLPLEIFTPDELAEYPVTSISRKATEILGIRGVCEPAALAAAGAGATLVISKHVKSGVTVAVSRQAVHQPRTGAS